MNQKILQKAINGLQEGLKDMSLRETKIIYVLGILETLAELTSITDKSDLAIKAIVDTPRVVTPNTTLSSDPEAQIMDAMAKANLETVKKGMMVE